MMLTKDFSLNGETVVATELTLGQYKKVQKAIESEGEIEATTLMVALSIDKPIEILDNLPASSIEDMAAITVWLSGLLSKS